MKLPIISSSGNRGSVLLVAVVSLAIMGMLLASHLALVSYQRRSVSESQVWNECISVAEAGLEEGLMNLNINGPGGLIASGNGWSTHSFSNGVFPGVWRQLGPRGNRYYVAYVDALSGPPRVVSKGYVRVPNSTRYLTRTVETRTKPSSPFPMAVLAKGLIKMNGNNVTVDSFDSRDALYSNAGLYDVNRRKTNGNVATLLGIVDAVNIGNNDIYGWAATAPGGTVAVGPNGFVKNGIRDDANYDIPDVKPPFTSAGPITPGSYNGDLYRYALGNGDYMYNGSLSPSGNGNGTSTEFDKVVVTGNARLYITGDFNLPGASRLVIAPGASVQIFVGGTAISMAGNAVLNPNGTASQLSLFGLPSMTSLTFSGNSQFTGAIYAPSADLKFNGGGNNRLDCMGAAVVKSITLNGHFSVHYDEALQTFGSQLTYKIASWREL